MQTPIDANNKDGPCLLKKIVFSLGTFLVLFVFLEGISILLLKLYNKPLTGDRAFHPLFRTITTGDTKRKDTRFLYDPHLLYRYRPNTTYGPWEPEGVPLSINEHGFVDNGNEFPNLIHKPEGTTRVFVLGGSSLVGTGASSNHMTIPAKLEAILNKKGSYEVINAGVDGYQASQERMYLLSDIIYYHPDIVVFYDGGNDYGHPVFSGGYRDEYQKSHARMNHHDNALYLLFAFPKALNQGIININANILIDKTYTTMVMRMGINKILHRDYIKGANLAVGRIKNKVLLSPEEAARLFIDQIKGTIGAATAHGIKIIYILQPALVTKKELTEDEMKMFETRPALNNTFISNSDTYRRYWRSAQEGFVRLGKTFNNEQSCILDFSGSMWDGVREKVYLDELHTNDRGNQIIAEKLAKILISFEKGVCADS